MAGYIGTKAVLLSTTAATVGGDADIGGALDVGGAIAGVNVTLSGGVYLGGTGSANKLDDYEEGTWTPVYQGVGSNPTVTYDTVTGGRYTKIGNLVVASFLLKTDARSGGSGNVYISGLPFTGVSTGNFNSGNCVLGEITAFGGDNPSHARQQQGSTFINLLYRTSSNGAETVLQVSDLGTGINSNILGGTVIYHTA